MKHIVSFTDVKIQKLFSGRLNYDLRFFIKKPEFLSKLSVGDIVYFRKKQGEVLGQFSVEKLIIVENFEVRDWNWIKEINNFVIPGLTRNPEQNKPGSQIKFGMTQQDFEKFAYENSILIIIQIDKLEQFITSPIEIDKRSKKEWIVLGNI